MKLLIDLNFHDGSLTSYARQDLKQFIRSIFLHQTPAGAAPEELVIKTRDVV